MNQEGKQFTLDILVDGNIIGDTSSLTLTDNQMYAEARMDTYICTLNRTDFELFIESHPKVALKLMKLYPHA